MSLSRFSFFSILYLLSSILSHHLLASPTTFSLSIVIPEPAMMFLLLPTLLFFRRRPS